MTKWGTWCAAFTIELDGILLDWSELSSITRTQILLALWKGVTSGELHEDEAWEKAAS
ncbi:hypothetical protein [Pseudoflavonifractor sp. An184]|uniref:hypothetical protein n=1 Tax=Pseudoflavonifractor sp. An184 TaxID=1965576 RepID=UPI0013A66CEE|nr:hypothetical protein [Pseudoflavonifractor sp. An184]